MDPNYYRLSISPTSFLWEDLHSHCSPTIVLTIKKKKNGFNGFKSWRRRRGEKKHVRIGWEENPQDPVLGILLCCCFLLPTFAILFKISRKTVFFQSLLIGFLF